MDMYDEIPSLVFDIGSSLCKIGWAGDDAPREIFGSVVRRQGQVREWVIQDGYIANWEGMEALWRRSFTGLQKSSKEVYVMMTEPVLTPWRSRQRSFEILFERFECRGVFAVPEGMCALYSTGRTTGITALVGHGVSEYWPAYEGYALNGVSRTNLSGNAVTDYLMGLLQVKQSFSTTYDRDVVQRQKEKYAAASVNIERETAGQGDQFALPDGRMVNIGMERFQCAEVLFNPSLIGRPDTDSLPSQIFDSIMRSEIDTRKELFSNIMLCGGTGGRLQGLSKRLTDELKKLAPESMRIKVVAQQEHSGWIGGSIFGSLSTTQPIMLRKEEYDEYGAQRPSGGGLPGGGGVTGDTNFLVGDEANLPPTPNVLDMFCGACKGKARGLQDHICPAAFPPCPLCKTPVAAGKLWTHYIACPANRVACYCDTEVAMGEFASHVHDHHLLPRELFEWQEFGDFKADFGQWTYNGRMTAPREGVKAKITNRLPMLETRSYEKVLAQCPKCKERGVAERALVTPDELTRSRLVAQQFWVEGKEAHLTAPFRTPAVISLVRGPAPSWTRSPVPQLEMTELWEGHECSTPPDATKNKYLPEGFGFFLFPRAYNSLGLLDRETLAMTLVKKNPFWVCDLPAVNVSGGSTAVVKVEGGSITLAGHMIQSFFGQSRAFLLTFFERWPGWIAALVLDYIYTPKPVS